MITQARPEKSGASIRRIWRRRRDSNPRGPFEPNGFQDRRFQPLTHSSVSKYNVQLLLVGRLVTIWRSIAAFWCTLSPNCDRNFFRRAGTHEPGNAHIPRIFGQILTIESKPFQIVGDCRCQKHPPAQTTRALPAKHDNACSRWETTATIDVLPGRPLLRCLKPLSVHWPQEVWRPHVRKSGFPAK
jgi:hypothetical protein